MTTKRLFKWLLLGSVAVVTVIYAAEDDFLFWQEGADGKPALLRKSPAAGQLLRFDSMKKLQPWSLIVGTDDLGEEAVRSGNIADGEVKSVDIEDGGVATIDLADGAVTALKTAPGTLTGGYVLEGRLPDLAAYTEILRQELNTEGRFAPEVAGYVAGSYGSGVAWHPTRQRLYIVDNAGPGLMEFGPNGRHLRTITLSGFDDVEAIVWMGPNQGTGSAAGTHFALAEEVVTTGGVSRGAVVVVTIPATGSVTITKGSGGNWVRTVNPQWTAVQSNLGLEALGVNYAGTTFFAATEKAEVDADWKIYTFANSTGDQAVTAQADLTTLLSGVANDVSDLTVIQQPGGQYHLLVLSHEGTTGSTGPGKLINMGPNSMHDASTYNWVIHSQLTLPAWLTVAEGVACTPDGRTIFVTGEKGSDSMAKLLILQAP